MTQQIITAAAVAAAAAALLSWPARLLRWLERQSAQDRDIAAIKAEQSLLTYGVLACLKGLHEQGCNGPVSEAIDRIEEHLNRAAHR